MRVSGAHAYAAVKPQIFLRYPRGLVNSAALVFRRRCASAIREVQHFLWGSSGRLAAFSRFAAVGVLGTLVNLFVMALLVHTVLDISYVFASVIAAEVSMMHNFVLQERFVFNNERSGAGTWRMRLVQHLVFNNAESLVRLPLLVLVVEMLQIRAVLAQALTLVLSFSVRFLFASRVVYRGQQTPATPRPGDRDPVTETTT